MMKYIGLDAHISSCSFHVLDSFGKSLDWCELPTNGAMLVKHVKEIEGEKILCFEETGLSRWLYGLLHREVDKLIVCDPVKNRYKAIFRSQGIHQKGTAVYSDESFLIF